MTDTDSQMMRRQQALDNRQTIAPDETRAPKDWADSDAASAHAREAALNGTAVYEREQQDAIFEENKVFEEPVEESVEISARSSDPENSLVQRGRSQLKR
ncbi:hypothetical protein ASG43_14005 [Aureimonas sp. Leaf454]|uniref:hypothetical protein n=1 Tax=Aureimonas sp. Leaf454 TaxID=1736381 RepID=UPI00070165A5|nr:hypothetical protein [Aureimonas sp. Leaf454]KQT44455.1 hypothetical protein ASG43_14005 [Aureimonas sp. Leaf454]